MQGKGPPPEEIPQENGPKRGQGPLLGDFRDVDRVSWWRALPYRGEPISHQHVELGGRRDMDKPRQPTRLDDLAFLDRHDVLPG